ncbi:hypothetical protein HDV02_004129 [Globomyces sp. JEL0801]|nr:hypothetical protein HDV02_004129 [Globomyces sp. JEL0801]
MVHQLQTTAQPKQKKPMNAFFVYRRQMRKRIMELYNVHKSQDISKIAGQCWAKEPSTVRKYFCQLAMKTQRESEDLKANEEFLRHQRRYSDSFLLSPDDSIQNLSCYSYPVLDGNSNTVNTTEDDEQLTPTLSSSLPTPTLSSFATTPTVPSGELNTQPMFTSSQKLSKDFSSSPLLCPPSFITNNQHQHYKTYNMLTSNYPYVGQNRNPSFKTTTLSNPYIDCPNLDFMPFGWTPFEFDFKPTMNGTYNFDSMLSELIKSGL